jgi:hypothetical protein
MKYIEIFISMAFQNISKMWDFWYENTYTIWQPWYICAYLYIQSNLLAFAKNGEILAKVLCKTSRQRLSFEPKFTADATSKANFATNCSPITVLFLLCKTYLSSSFVAEGK